MFVNGTFYTYIKAQTHQETVVSRMLKCVSIQNLIKIYNVIQDLFAFFLTANGRATRLTKRLKCTPTGRAINNISYMRSDSSKMAVTHVSGEAMLTCITMRNLIKTYHVFHEL